MRKPLTAEQVRENLRDICKIVIKGWQGNHVFSGGVRNPESMTSDELGELSVACERAYCDIDSYVVDRTNAKPDYMET